MAIQITLLLRAFLVQPVRRDTVVGRLVHFARADLDLEQLLARSEHGRVQRLIAVRLRLRDVVLDAFLHRLPLLVDHAERVITIGNGVDEHTNREQIEDLLVRLVAFLHLLPDRPEMLRSSGDIGVVQTGQVEALLERQRHLRDQFLTFATTRADLPRERAILVRLEILEGQVLELPAHFRHAEAMGERRVDIARFLRDEALLVIGHPVERPHVVQAVGELDDDHARVTRDRQQQLAISLGLSLFLRRERQIADLRQTIDDLRDLRSEFAFDIRHRDGGVLDHVVNQAGGDRDGVELEIGEDARDLHAVHDVVLARTTLLTGMRARAVAIRALQQLAIETRRQWTARTPSRKDFIRQLHRTVDSHPASAKLTYLPRPITTWSRTGIPSSVPAATSCDVTIRSSGDGVGSPLG